MDETAELTALPETFHPLFELLLLIWQNSPYYNKTARLVVLLRQVCSSVIAQCMRHVSGQDVFRLLQQDEPKEALDKLTTALEVAGKCFFYSTATFAWLQLEEWRLHSVTKLPFVAFRYVMLSSRAFLNTKKGLSQKGLHGILRPMWFFWGLLLTLKETWHLPNLLPPYNSSANLKR